MNEQNIPIDIHSNKLLDWLISRRHCSKDWQQSILIIREKINNAIQDMPVHDRILQLLSGSYINYFHCLTIIDILKETEADSKNIFGRYGSQRMRDWQEIVKLYERENVYLAEAAQMLVRNVNFEVPSIKKQIQKLEQIQKECDKKEKDYAKIEKNIRNEFNVLCKQLGISGKNIKNELVELLDELPTIYKEVAKVVENVSPAIELYNEFLKYTVGQEDFKNCLTLLKYIIEHGNVTTYEWTYGEPPLSIEEPLLNIGIDEDQSSLQNDIIDFGAGSGDIDFGNLSTDNEIDFGDANITLEQGDIDWGAPSENVGITEATIDEISLEESGIIVESSGTEGGIAKGREAYTLLDNPETRSVFIDELTELESFLKMRLYELSSESSYVGLSHLQTNSSTALQLQTTESVTVLLTGVQGVIASISNSRVQHLHSIKHSPRYVDYLTNLLKQKVNAAEKMTASQKVVQSRREEAAQQIVNLQPILERLVEKTKELQLQIEGDISKKYKNRTVNLMGGINSL